MIVLVIPDVLPSLNVQRRMHYAEYAKMRRSWSWQVWAAMNGKMPAEPIPVAHIKLCRTSPDRLDFDNLVGCHKPLLDVLRPLSKNNPNGLGVILDDDDKHLTVAYSQARAAKAETRLVIEAVARAAA